MGYIKEPPGIDFVVDSTPLTNEDAKKISEAIAYFKATGKKMPLKANTRRINSKANAKKLPISNL
jgi:hypothetical protein